MVLGTSRTPLEVLAHSRNAGVGVCLPQLQLDVAIELLEAFLTAQLGPLRSEQPLEHAVLARVSVFAGQLGPAISSSGTNRSPASARWARSFLRASWIVL